MVAKQLPFNTRNFSAEQERKTVPYMLNKKKKTLTICEGRNLASRVATRQTASDTLNLPFEQRCETCTPNCE